MLLINSNASFKRLLSGTAPCAKSGRPPPLPPNILAKSFKDKKFYKFLNTNELNTLSSNNKWNKDIFKYMFIQNDFDAHFNDKNYTNGSIHILKKIIEEIQTQINDLNKDEKNFSENWSF